MRTKQRLRSMLGLLTAFVVALAAMTALPNAAVAQSPQEECASLGAGWTFVTKLDGIPDPGGDGPHSYTGTTVEGPAAGGTASITWTKNPNTLTIDSTSFAYDGYVEKRGEGGGLSHVTFCALDEDPTPTSTPETPTPTATTPAETPTTPVETPTTPAETPVTPGETPTKKVEMPETKATTPAAVVELPSTGSGDSGSGGTSPLLLIVAAMILVGGAFVARRSMSQA